MRCVQPRFHQALSRDLGVCDRGLGVRLHMCGNQVAFRGLGVRLHMCSNQVAFRSRSQRAASLDWSACQTPTSPTAGIEHNTCISRLHRMVSHAQLQNMPAKPTVTALHMQLKRLLSLVSAHSC